MVTNAFKVSHVICRIRLICWTFLRNDRTVMQFKLKNLTRRLEMQTHNLCELCQAKSECYDIWTQKMVKYVCIWAQIYKVLCCSFESTSFSYHMQKANSLIRCACFFFFIFFFLVFCCCFFVCFFQL